MTNTQNNQIYAAKQIRLDKIAGTENERKFLQTFTSPFIVQYIEYYIAGDYMYIIMEYCEHGSLRKFIQENKERSTYQSEDVSSHSILVTSNLFLGVLEVFSICRTWNKPTSFQKHHSS